MAEAEKAQAEAAKAIEQAKAVVPDLQIKAMDAMKPDGDLPMDFKMRKEIGSLLVKEQDIASNERIAAMQMAQKMQ
jgi:hypothetical protein